MSLETALIAFANTVGGDIKGLNVKLGDMTALTTTQKISVVAALNSLKTELTTVQNAQANAVGINDGAVTSSTTETYSVAKIIALIDASNVALKGDILDSAPAALDTLRELSAGLQDNPNFATDIAVSIGSRVRFDEAQVITDPQKLIARTNIGAASAADLTALTTGVGDTNVDLVTIYNTAKA